MNEVHWSAHVSNLINPYFIRRTNFEIEAVGSAKLSYSRESIVKAYSLEETPRQFLSRCISL